MEIVEERISEEKVLEEAAGRAGKIKKTEWLPAGFGERERQLREKNRLTLESVAQKFGTSAATISRLENGLSTTVSIDLLSGLADLYKVSVDFLLGKVDRPERTYYSLRDIGLSSKAGLALYSGKADPGTVSLLLEDKRFGRLTHEIRDYVAYDPDGRDFLIEVASSNKFQYICGYFARIPNASGVGRYMTGLNRLKMKKSEDSLGNELKTIVEDMRNRKQVCVRNSAQLTTELLLMMKETHPELEGKAQKEIRADVIADKIVELFAGNGKMSNENRDFLKYLRDALLMLRLDDEEENGKDFRKETDK